MTDLPSSNDLVFTSAKIQDHNKKAGLPLATTNLVVQEIGSAQQTLHWEILAVFTARKSTGFHYNAISSSSRLAAASLSFPRSANHNIPHRWPLLTTVTLPAYQV
ncbi:hypothetical protein GUJ93_ZPchr0014g46883 [Zizania palustris]|uniref:Uncharacterized protein n=1 Tax=Zizania palustris TaxID=103762 RepID=A0A8J5W5R1_ZIZPA|nr:hypothetical protein GUJ93_ZPchr0014g46883 [Zizania palustris]